MSAFFDLAFVQGHASDAARLYISETQYIQHNPNGQSGRDAFLAGFANFVESSSYRCTVKRTVAEGDLVVIHSHCRNTPDDPNNLGDAVVDIFRVEDGKIVEHWDVEQPVPLNPKNRLNGMF